MQKYSRYENESEEDYQIRICGLRAVNDMTWEEVAGIINKELGLNCNESTYRKKYQMYIKGYQKKEKEIASGDALLSEYNVKIEELKKERYKLQATNIENNRNLRQKSRFELFYENIGKKIESLPLPEGFERIEAEQFGKEYLLTIADAHAGAKFNCTNNSYSLDICRQRFELLYDKVCDFIMEHDLNELKVLSLGDEVQGILRISDLKLNEIPVVDAVVFISRLLAQFLVDLTKFVRVDYYHVAKSNHTQTRPLGTKASEIADEDISRIIINYISDLVRDNPNICVHTDLEKDYLDFEIHNFSIFASHGHNIQNIYTYQKDICANHRKFYDYVIVGHSHCSKEIITAEGKLHNVETLVAPSIVGSDPYADKLIVGSKAMCKIFEFDEVYGHTASYNIILN